MPKLVLCGVDPELFVMQNGIYKSAHGLIKGDKLNPFPVDKGAVQVDGMALEFNIDPASSEKEFITNINTVMKILKDMVPEYDVVADPVAYFTREYMDAQPKEAKMLGCEPDFNGWTMDKNIKPDVDAPFRTGAGHIHVGVCEGQDINDQSFFEVCCNAVKEMDVFLGLPSMFYDNDTKRRELYGKAGAFRPKSYGFEYRTLSNRWLANDDLMSWVYKATQNCMKSFFAGERISDKYKGIQEIINSSNKKEAEKIIFAEGLLMPQGI